MWSTLDPEVDLRFKTVVKAVIIHDNLESCTAGYLPNDIDL
jgi:hypothetical protein